jgi:DNA-binding CsgD family transcriptional regulator
MCIAVESQSEYFKNYPEVEKLGEVDVNWSNAVAVPILPFGAFFLALNGEPSRDGSFEPFLRCIGHLLALSLRQSAEKGSGVDVKSARKKSSSKELTSRQEVIVELLSKGFTNNEISKEIGYSESLIRQETVTIYAVIGVSGRKELIRMIDSQSIKA